MINIDITEFIRRLYEMEYVTVIVPNNPSETAGGGYSGIVGECWNSQETIEILFEDDNPCFIKKADIQSISANDNRIIVLCKNGFYYLFEQD